MLRDAEGNDLLWNGDRRLLDRPRAHPVSHRRRAERRPLLLAAHRYALPRHGFARDRRFEVVRNARAEAVFRHIADAETLKVYPFRFELDVAFRLEGAALEIEARCATPATSPCQQAWAFIPPFAGRCHTAEARDAHYIEFETEEAAPHPPARCPGLAHDERHPTPVRGRDLPCRTRCSRRTC